MGVRLVLLAGLTALSGCGLLASHSAQPLAQDYRVVGYVTGWKPFPHIDPVRVTVLDYAFAHIKAGQIVVDAPGADEFIARMCDLKTRNPKLRILISVGGWGADGFSDAALSDASRRRFADSAVAAIRQFHVDGVDLDWEYPGRPGPGIKYRAQDKRDFSLLLQALRQRLDVLGAKNQHRYLLTAALADSRFVAHIELDRIHRYLDWIDLMTYDFHNSLTPTTGHHSALSPSLTSAPDERSVEGAVGQFLAAGVPARKLVVGVPFYGLAFDGVTPANHGLDQPYAKFAKSIPWSDLKADYIDRNGYRRYWDSVAEEPFLWNAAKREFISYDDPQSLHIKADFVKAHGLGGMMYWEQSQDPQGQLTGVLASGLDIRTTSASPH